jgi:hypothetical protein
MIDVDERRAMILSLHRLDNVDRAWVFYYDETNNVRKLHIRDGVINVATPEPFVLGGIVDGERRGLLDLRDLRKALKLQNTIHEIKLRHLGSGDFLQLLNSERIEIFLRWIAEQGFFIHYQATDLLYWSSVDIVDSIIAGTKEAALAEFQFAYKDSLFAILRDDIASTVALFGRYNYPDVGEQHQAFLGELLNVLDHQDERLDPFARYMLKGLVQLGRKLDRLPFLVDEAPNVLVDGLGPFALERVCLFKHAEHIFDEEPVIERFLTQMELGEGGKPFRNYRFADSATEAGIQIADVVAGIIGKAFGYVTRTPLGPLEKDLAGLSSQQRRSLRLLGSHLDRATDECGAFAHYIISLEDQRRASLLFSS